MHHVWHSAIIAHVGTSEKFWLNDLAQLDKEDRAAWMKGTVEEWATESLLAVMAAYKDHHAGSGEEMSCFFCDHYHNKHYIGAGTR